MLYLTAKRRNVDDRPWVDHSIVRCQKYGQIFGQGPCYYWDLACTVAMKGEDFQVIGGPSTKREKLFRPHCLQLDTRGWAFNLLLVRAHTIDPVSEDVCPVETALCMSPPAGTGVQAIQSLSTDNLSDLFTHSQLQALFSIPISNRFTVKLRTLKMDKTWIGGITTEQWTLYILATRSMTMPSTPAPLSALRAQ